MSLTNRIILKKKAYNWIGSALAYWVGRGFDYETGLFRETLDFDGADGKSGILRCCVQARQLFVLSEAKLEGYDIPEMVLEAGYAALETYFAHADGGYITLVNSDGSTRNATREFYDQTFVLLALASLYQRTQAPHLLEKAKQLIFFLETKMAHPSGGFCEALADDMVDDMVDDIADEDVALRPRRQNPHMHFFEACLLFYKVSHEEVFSTHAQKILRLLQNHFVSDDGQLYEYFTQDWQPLETNQIIEVGHHFEWIYLLYDYGESVETEGSIGNKLMQFAFKNGLDRNSVYALDIVGKNTRRLWVQTELIRAMTIVQGYEDKRNDLTLSIFDDYLGLEQTGLWFDKFDLQGNLKTRCVPASTFYHLWGAMNLLINHEANMLIGDAA